MKLKTLFPFKAKVVEPCNKLLSLFKHKFKKPSLSSRTPTFRMSNRRSKPRIRTKVVRFRKPFSIKALRFPRFRRKNRSRTKKTRPSLSSKFKKTFRRKKPVRQPKQPVQKVRIAELLTVLFSLRKTKDVDVDVDVDIESCDQAMGDASVSMSMSEGGPAKEPFPSPITPGYVRKSDDSKKESSDDLEDVEGTCKGLENYLTDMIIDEGKIKDLMDVEDLLYCWRNLKSPVFIDLVSRFYGEVCNDLFSPSEEKDSLETSETQETNINSE